MKKKFIFLFCILHCILYSHLSARVKEIKLRNGLMILLKEDHKLPIVSIQLWVKVGSRDEDSVNSGISHLIEHMLFKGTEKYPGEAIYSEIEKRGGIINAGTSMDFTYFYVTLPTKIEKYLGETTPVKINQDSLFIGLDILSQMVRKTLFAEDELEREKLVIAEELERKLDDPQSYIWDLFNSALYSGHPYSRTVLGTSESVRHISREDILNYYNKWYIPANCILVVVGDFKEKDVLTICKRAFDEGKTFQISKAKIEKEESIYSSNLEIKRPVHQVYLIMGVIGPDAIDDDCYPMDIISYILGKGRYSRLYRKLREEKRFVWSVSSSFLTQKEKGPFYISVECDTDKILLVKEILAQELKRISDEMVTREEIERAKLLFESEYLLSTESYFGEAFNLGYYQTISSYKIALEYLRKILKVSAADIKRVANKYLDSEKFICVMIKPSEE